jgi:hypothetical protein
MLGWILKILFGCRHRRKSLPMSTVPGRGDSQGGTFVVCLDCGTRFRYDWEQMRTGKAVDEPQPKPR